MSKKSKRCFRGYNEYEEELFKQFDSIGRVSLLGDCVSGIFCSIALLQSAIFVMVCIMRKDRRHGRYCCVSTKETLLYTIVSEHL